jgi:hypothetical protein
MSRVHIEVLYARKLLFRRHFLSFFRKITCNTLSQSLRSKCKAHFILQGLVRFWYKYVGLV